RGRRRDVCPAGAAPSPAPPGAGVRAGRSAGGRGAPRLPARVLPSHGPAAPRRHRRPRKSPSESGAERRGGGGGPRPVPPPGAIAEPPVGPRSPVAGQIGSDEDLIATLVRFCRRSVGAADGPALHAVAPIKRRGRASSR